MGEIDIAVLEEVRFGIMGLCKEYCWPYQFRIDLGTFETAVVFMGNGAYRKPLEDETWDDLKEKGHILLCPDMLDWSHKIIIEYEEEAKPMRGPKIVKKGHWEESKRDTRRDTAYKQAGFALLKIWESDWKNGTWQSKAKEFFVNCTVVEKR